MEIKELIQMLNDIVDDNPEATVYIGTRGRHSAVASHVSGPVRLRDTDSTQECDGTVYIVSDGDCKNIPLSLFD